MLSADLIIDVRWMLPITPAEVVLNDYYPVIAGIPGSHRRWRAARLPASVAKWLRGTRTMIGGQITCAATGLWLAHWPFEST